MSLKELWGQSHLLALLPLIWLDQGFPNPRPRPVQNQAMGEIGKCGWSFTFTSGGHLLVCVKLHPNGTSCTSASALCSGAFHLHKWSFTCKCERLPLMWVERHAWARTPSACAWISIHMNGGHVPFAQMEQGVRASATHRYPTPGRATKLETLETLG